MNTTPLPKLRLPRQLDSARGRLVTAGFAETEASRCPSATVGISISRPPMKREDRIGVPDPYFAAGNHIQPMESRTA
jgi:hypothetical protein